MTAVEKNTAPSMDHAILARLTGGLGDRRTITRIGNDIGQIYADFLPDIFHSETGIEIAVEYEGATSGLMSELLAGLGQDFATADCSLRNWSPFFVLGCGNSFVMALMERMLGALPETIEQPIPRALTKMELELAGIVVGRIAGVLRSSIDAPGGFEPAVESPRNSAGRPPLDERVGKSYALAIRMKVRLASVTSDIVLVLPQSTLLKTKIVPPGTSVQAAKKKQEWIDLITEQVKRSQVTLQARIRLQKLTLANISRLVEGDVIAFRDRGEVTAEVSANGRDMYRCEFGRSGERYTVRVKDNISTDDEILRHLMG